MPNTIAENLQRLQTAQTAISSAIAAKSVVVPSGSGFEDFPDLISQIVTAPAFYEGTLLGVNVYPEIHAPTTMLFLSSDTSQDTRNFKIIACFSLEESVQISQPLVTVTWQLSDSDEVIPANISLGTCTGIFLSVNEPSEQHVYRQITQNNFETAYNRSTRSLTFTFRPSTSESEYVYLPMNSTNYIVLDGSVTLR